MLVDSIEDLGDGQASPKILDWFDLPGFLNLYAYKPAYKPLVLDNADVSDSPIKLLSKGPSFSPTPLDHHICLPWKKILWTGEKE